MKISRIYRIFLVALMVVALGSCSEDEETFTTWPEPAWTVSSPEMLPNSFTAVVAIPQNLNIYASDNDKLAAFINDECRGVGNLIKDEITGKRVYFLTIRANDTESGAVTFRYYNAQLAYLYQAESSISFEADGTYGSYDAPIVLDLQNL